ncbi:MAG: TsoY family (seleno)protein, partial [Campylobacterota bacterium]
MAKVTNLKEKYNPMYFLAALGAGGLTVSFFMYLNFLIPHPGTAMVTADHLFALIAKANIISFLVILAFVAIVFFAYKHIELLIWNIKEYNLYKQTDAFVKLKTSNAEVSLMAIPLTYSMAINVMFVLGATFVPGLWSIIEYMLPMALLGFLGVGIYGLKIYAEYFTRIIVNGDFDYSANNNFSQLIAIFAFSMIAVGFAAPGAMSQNMIVSAIGIFGAVFFAVISVTLALVKIVLALRDILEKGVGEEASVSLWVMIPILTVLGITFIRITFGFSHNFMGYDQPSNWFLFLLTSTIFSLQLIFGF